MNKKILAALVLLAVGACKKAEKTEESTPIAEEVVTRNVPTFQADSAYAYVEKQVSFGPRVPGTAAQVKCASWLSGKFKSLGYNVHEQKFTATLYNNSSVPGINIIASYKPEVEKRILLAAHWDSRAYSDQDASQKNQAIDGANDGASGVGVLLEIARNLVKDSAQVGVDFVLFDVEDWGAPDSYTGKLDHPYGGYCLGSEYWSKNPHKKPYTAYYGILLDMVGAENATFYHELTSYNVAPTVISTVWSTASQLGFGKYFINSKGSAITDDHLPVIQNLGIPMIDIIDYRFNGTESGFFPHWHTTGDKMNTISKSTLTAVGQTLLHVLYHE
jgi:glutaminyl-peptide cyclotransferase